MALVCFVVRSRSCGRPFFIQGLSEGLKSINTLVVVCVDASV